MLVVRRLIWDPWNIAHIARHEVTPEEVEEVCHGNPVVQAGKQGCSPLFGPTGSGRMLTVVIDHEPGGMGVYCPVTARPASRRERAIYAGGRGGDIE